MTQNAVIELLLTDLCVAYKQLRSANLTVDEILGQLAIAEDELPNGDSSNFRNNTQRNTH